MSERIVEGVRISNPDKILYPEQGITKAELADYYVSVAEWALPHLALRPITLVRCPTGRQKKCFYQRHAGAGISREVERVVVPGFDNPYVFIRDLPGLVALVQMGVLEIHPWGVTVERPDQADRVIIDLDPGEGVAFEAVVAAARQVRERLAGMGLESFAKTTGGKGLHVIVPIEPVHPWPEVKAWARRLAESMAKDAPDDFLVRASIEERKGRIFVDYLRNDPTATAVGPYSTRARAGAPIAFPLDWSEVTKGLDPGRFLLREVPSILSGRDDPWSEIHRIRQRLPGVETA